MTRTPEHAIVLAGGRGSRLGGLDKTALRFDGRSLLDHALASVAGARHRVVVGPESLSSRLPAGVELVIERTPFGGPAAAPIAALAAIGAAPGTRVVLLAADLPRAPAAVRELLAVGRLAECVDGVVATDGSGSAQPLLAIYDTAALAAAAARAAATGPLEGLSMRSLLAPLLLCHVRLPDALCADIDTPDAAERHGIHLDAVPSHA